MGKTQEGAARPRRNRGMTVAAVTTVIWAITMSCGLVFPSAVSLGYVLMVGLTTLVAALAWVLLLLARRRQGAARWSLAQLRALSPDEFEEWTAARFGELGFEVKAAGTYGDSNVDLVAEKLGEFAVLQYKRYQEATVDERALSDLLSAMGDYGAQHAYLVTTGELTPAAREWAADKPVTVWDGAYLLELGRRPAPQLPTATGAGSEDDDRYEAQPDDFVPALTGFSPAEAEAPDADPEEAVPDPEEDSFAVEGPWLQQDDMPADPADLQQEDEDEAGPSPAAPQQDEPLPAISGWPAFSEQGDTEMGDDDYSMAKLLDDTEIALEEAAEGEAASAQPGEFAAEGTDCICPVCGSPLKVCTDPQTAERYLGCSRFPECRHTEPLA